MNIKQASEQSGVSAPNIRGAGNLRSASALLGEVQQTL